MAFELEALPYANDALEPHIDKETMEIHHDRHHQAYVDNLNKAIAGTDAENESLEDILKNVSKYSPAVRNNGGGHYNHRLFWSVLGANAGGEPKGELATAINEAFGSFDELKKKLQEAGATRFGSGWSWLIVGADGKLAVTSTPNQDNPLMDIAEVKGTPIFGIDVWEHAYYLKYQNKRPAYLEAVFNVVNWDAVAKNYAAAK
ncbi:MULTISPECIES: superoxide dismutase [Sphingobacterium]|uniref:superoxide dismutase n=1 Tax=Sphingobacterium TaxID=28453 RepID=UPI0013D939F4|nr:MULTISPECIES: superoxide dismutase [unclassified Sphingobacterium]